MIQHTIPLLTFPELSESAKKAAIKQAIDRDFFGDTVQIDCDSFVEDLRHYLEKIASVEAIGYSIGFSKSDFFRIKFSRIAWEKGVKKSLEYAPDFIVDFFNDIQTEFKKLVYLYRYTPNNYDEFVHVNTGMGHYFPDSVAAFEAATKRLEKACYRRLRNTVLYYSDDDNVVSLLQEDDNRLYTVDGAFYCFTWDVDSESI